MQNLSGIGMTSQRTRERLLGRLMDQGIQSMEVLDIMRSTPRHIFWMKRSRIGLMKMWPAHRAQSNNLAALRGCPHERGDSENGHHEQSA